MTLRRFRPHRFLALVGLLGTTLGALAPAQAQPSKTEAKAEEKAEVKSEASKAEAAEARVADLVKPAEPKRGTLLVTGPLAWRGLRWLEQPTLPPPPYRGNPPHPEPARPRARPLPLLEDPPLANNTQNPAPPAPVELPVQPLLRLPSVDVKEPIPLPILAQAQKDRASLADPTLESSIALALKPLTPARTQPVPFVPQNLPDPFENVAVGRLPSEPVEDTMPPVIPHRTPAK